MTATVKGIVKIHSGLVIDRAQLTRVDDPDHDILVTTLLPFKDKCVKITIKEVEE